MVRTCRTADPNPIWTDPKEVVLARYRPTNALLSIRMDGLQELAVGVSGSLVGPPQAILQCEATVHLPAILRIRLDRILAETAIENTLGLRSASIVAQQHVGELVAGIVRITGIWPKVQIQRIAPAGLLAVVVPVDINTGFETVGAPIVC